jgi:tRNA-dihydrouridine synthase B
MQIGQIRIDSPTVLAPLAGITNLPFRLLARSAGCGLVCSEMISANGLVHQSGKTLRMLDTAPGDHPLSVQIFGAEPGIMAAAAARVEAVGADLLDINFGCSVKKVVKTGAGAALMRTPENAEAVLDAVRKAIRIPLTIKIRTGWDPSGDQAVRIAEIAASCGVDALSVHPRTATQGFRGKADWSIIAAVKKRVSIPIIGNGDIFDPADALKMFEAAGCDGIMIGRAAIGNPMIFSQVRALLDGRAPLAVSIDARSEMMLRYLKASVEYIGEAHACRMMRSRLGWFVKGLRDSSRFRESIRRIATEQEAEALIRDYFGRLQAAEEKIV